MSDFTAEWLALREPADWRARSVHVTNAVASRFPPGEVLRAIDLAAGTGSNARFLAVHLKSPQRWLLLDRNRALLAHAQSQMGSAVRVEALDFARLEALEHHVTACDLVTASALLDLVSDAWLQGLCRHCRQNRFTLLFALSYDGRIECAPHDPDDERMRDLVNRHQHTDKGFGPALGPDAAARVGQLLESLGYQVIRDRSDWVLAPEAEALQRALISGWAAAAKAISPADAHRVEAWCGRRLSHVDASRSRLIVGHEDVGAFMA